MWKSIEIGARSAELFQPADRARSLLIFLRDWDAVSLRENQTWTSLLDNLGLACLCLDGGESWWADHHRPGFHSSLTAERYLRQEVLAWARTNLGHSSAALIGVGSGGQAALRLGFKHPETFRVVAGLASWIDHYELYGQGTSLDDMYPSREHCRQDGAILHVRPSHWPAHIWFACDPESPWLRGNDRLREKLVALGVPHHADLETRACGHSWNYYDRLAPQVLHFVADGLAKESRRLI